MFAFLQVVGFWRPRILGGEIGGISGRLRLGGTN